MKNTDENAKLIIALDAMGGDFAPLNEILGVIEVFKDPEWKDKIRVVLIGQKEALDKNLKGKNLDGCDYEILYAEDVVTMHDDPVDVLKSKKNSSLYQGVVLHKDGKADAFVSAGNTGAMLSTSTVLLGRIPGVSRPTIGSFFPTITGNPTLVLDVGATIEMKPRFLHEFAIMGSIYCSRVLGVQNPRIALLNIGEEKSKGTIAIKETYQLLKESNLNFIGNVEGRDILTGQADVIVCDGFTGNVVLKLAESFITILKAKFKNFASKGFFSKLQVALAVPVLKKILKDFDYQEYGGVPLLGVNGVVIIGHGKSTPKAIKNMIIRAAEISTSNINLEIQNAIGQI